MTAIPAFAGRLARGCLPNGVPGWCDPVASLPSRPCLPWPPGGPVSFRPGTCYAFAPHAAPWWSPSHVTAANLGWVILALLLAGSFLGGIQGWVTDRYEFIALPCRGFRFTVTRRWYGTHAQVCLRTEADDLEADRYVVLQRETGNTAVPWLKVHKLNPEFLTYWAEDSEAFWGPVTDFAPFAVRRFRPGVTLIGRVPVPGLWGYPLLPYPVRVPQEVRDAA